MNAEEYMQLAIEKAKSAKGYTNPNPMVGAVIVKDDRIISIDCHRKYGEYHAERNAILNSREDVNGATMYVTLEPCCHQGKTPPCTDIIIESGIKKVYVGSLDPNPLVAGKGIQILRDHGIEVETGILEEECFKLNTVFFHYITTKMPYVILKYAMTADGKIATYTGKSRWITGEAARKRVHETRRECMGIMVGSQTVIKDNPSLTCRIEGGKNPIRIICDTSLRIPLASEVVQTAGEVRTILATNCQDTDKLRQYEQAGCEVLFVGRKDGHLDLKELMTKLGERKIDSILLEGGGTLAESALKEGIVDKVETYIAPKIFGGKDAKTPVEGVGVAAPNQAYRLVRPTISMLGEDLLIEWEVDKCLQES